MDTEQQVEEILSTHTEEEVGKVVDKAVNWIMVIDFTITIAVYWLINRYISDFWAIAWLIASYAFTLKEGCDAMSMNIKNWISAKNSKSKELLNEDKQEDDKPSEVVESN